MRRSSPILAAIAVVGAFAGVVIAGQEATVDTFVIDPAVVDATSAAPVSTATDAAETTVPGDSATSTTPAVTTTTRPTPPSSSAQTSTTATSPATTTAPVQTTLPPNQTLPRDAVRLVLANGDGRYNLVTVNADRLRAAGYVEIIGGDTARVPATIVYYRPGFDDEAAVVAADVLVPNAILEPLPDTPITDNDSQGDVIVVLGPDAIR
jgi:hypothetical protein